MSNDIMHVFDKQVKHKCYYNINNEKLKKESIDFSIYLKNYRNPMLEGSLPYEGTEEKHCIQSYPKAQFYHCTWAHSQLNYVP